MTCIAAICDGYSVWIGADSAAGTENHVEIYREPKVFLIDEFVIGYTTSFRMGQLLQFSFNPPLHKRGVSDYEYMVTDFIGRVKMTFGNGGFMGKVKEGADAGGSFLVGYKGKIYRVESDFQIATPKLPFSSVGSGYREALGSMLTTHKIQKLNLAPDPEIEKAIESALSVAQYFTPFVRGPFKILQKEKGANAGVIERKKKAALKAKKKRKK